MRWFSALFFIISALLNACSTAEDRVTFRKCCPRNQSLIKLETFNNESVLLESFECVDSDDVRQKFDINSFSQIVISDNIPVTYEIPNACSLQMVQAKEVELVTPPSTCYDRIILEVINGTITHMIPKTIALYCIPNNEDLRNMKINVELLRKCCPSGQAYDTVYHVCRIVQKDMSSEWLLNSLNVANNSYVYDVETGLNCKSKEYSVELRHGEFSFEIHDSVLNIYDGNEWKKINRGNWCVDADYNTEGVVARVCTHNCTQYGAFCYRKCCPIGHNYLPFHCGSTRSKCVPSNNTLFNMSIYLDPLQEMDPNLLDVQGIRTDLKCKAGKFALNPDKDTHWLGRSGLLEGTPWDPQEYCFEMMDFRSCPGGDIVVTPIACLITAISPTHDYLLRAVCNTVSAVFLTLTLVVYLSLPELRNLSGRTVICHLITMLFGYSCLARAQYRVVESITLCTLLGYGIYFGFVGAFVWLNVMCFDIWWTFGNIRSVQPLRKANAERRRFMWYSLYAWGVTLLFTTIVFFLDKYPVSSVLKANMGQGACWFGTTQNTSTDWPHYIFFVIPMGVMTSINLVLWILTARHCARVKSEVHRMQAGSVGERAKKRFRLDRAKYVLTGKLWVVMGAGWISECLSTLFSSPPWLWASIDLINQLQGFFIFIIFVLKPKVYHLIKKRLGLEKPDAQKNGTSSSARTSSTFLSRTISSDERAIMRASLPEAKKH